MDRPVFLPAILSTLFNVNRYFLQWKKVEKILRDNNDWARMSTFKVVNHRPYVSCVLNLSRIRLDQYSSGFTGDMNNHILSFMITNNKLTSCEC